MKLPRALLLTLATTTGQARAHVFRAVQEEESGDGAFDITIISGSGVEEAELPPDASNTIEIPDYSTDQCAQWIEGVYEADIDNSGGLSSTEFHDFLINIEEPPYVAEYFDQHATYIALPWMFKIVHKALACRCRELGYDSGCCTGVDAEVPLLGLREEDTADMTVGLQKVAAEYRNDLCNSVAAVFQEVIPVPSPTVSPSGSLVVGGGEVVETAAPTMTAAPTSTTNAAIAITSPTTTTTEEDTSEGDVPAMGIVFECSNATLCNINEPSVMDDEESGEPTGWTSIGDCGDDTTDLGECPPAHDGDATYVEDDQVTIAVTLVVPPTLEPEIAPPPMGMAFECANATICNDNEPSMEEEISGWTLLGDCGDDMDDADYGECPPAYDGDAEYGIEDVVSANVEVDVDVDDVTPPPAPEMGVVFECSNATICNDNEPSTEEDYESGWTTIGDCGADTDMEDCPPAHDGDATYEEEDQVTIIASPETLPEEDDDDDEVVVEPEAPEMGMVYECINEGMCSDNLPSSTDDSGWKSVGDCGADTDVLCPPAHDDNAEYNRGDQVTIVPEVDPLPPSPTPFVGMEHDIVGSVLNYASFDYNVIYDGSNEGVPEFYNAQEISSNEGENGVLGEVIRAYGQLATELSVGLMDGVTEEGKRNLRSSKDGRALQLDSMGQMSPVQVTDIACPEGLMYAPKEVYCLNFKFRVTPGASVSEDAVAAFSDLMLTAIDTEGRLYDIVKKSKADTVISGLGNPGKGIDYTVPSSSGGGGGGGSSNIENNIVVEDDDGLSTAAIVFIILAVIFIPMAVIAMYARYRKVQDDERKERLREYKEQRDLEAGEAEPVAGAMPQEDDESDAPSVWSESHHESKEGFVEGDNREVVATAGSSLAAMGAAGAAATMGISKSSSEDSKAEIRSEVRNLVGEINAPKTADELMEAYAGREMLLLSHLHTMREKQQGEDVKKEITDLVERTKPGKSAEELLTAYAGREDELAMNLRKMKVKQDTAEIKSLVAKTNPGKSADELMSAYTGREDELIKNLKKMKAEQDAGEVATLVELTKAPKSSKELLAAYEGKEDQLIQNLKKMKTKQDKEEISALVESTKPGKSTKELMEAYVGREDELIKNLRKMQEKQASDAAKVPSYTDEAATRAKVESLVAQTNPGKSAEELLAAYEGREQELITHLSKLSSSKRNIV